MIIISPFRETASSVLLRVSTMDSAVCSLVQNGSVNMSRTVPISVPIDLWNSTISLLVSSTSPYMWLWKVPESVIMIPG